jgi:hypothetical protein
MYKDWVQKCGWGVFTYVEQEQFSISQPLDDVPNDGLGDIPISSTTNPDNGNSADSVFPSLSRIHCLFICVFFLSPSPGVVVILFNRVIGDHTALVRPKDYHHALSLQTLPLYSTELARSPLMSFLVVLSISSSLESIARYSHTL